VYQVGINKGTTY